jgi:hypothetical protein
MNNEIVNFTTLAVNNAISEQSKLTPDILKISGMSSNKVRHFLNNIITPTSRYLEIGSWRGSTFVSALFKNNPEIAFAIDNWSEFTDPNLQSGSGVGPQQAFMENVKKYITCDYNVIEGDCFKINPVENRIKNINTFFYDGSHDLNSQKQALTYYYDFLSDCFIFMVDDWNEDSTRIGTKIAIEELNLKTIYEYVGKADHNGDRKNWWNGFYISVLKK